MKLREGDRVAIYGTTDRVPSDMPNGIPTAYRRGCKGTVESICCPDDPDCDEIDVGLDKGSWVTVHPKQCRKLVAAKPKRTCDFCGVEASKLYTSKEEKILCADCVLDCLFIVLEPRDDS